MPTFMYAEDLVTKLFNFDFFYLKKKKILFYNAMYKRNGKSWKICCKDPEYSHRKTAFTSIKATVTKLFL